MRQHRTTLEPQDVALLGSERDLSIICQRYVFEVQFEDVRLGMKCRVCLFDCLCLVVGNQERRVQCETRMSEEEI